MSTFLALCQRVAQESGTVSGVQPVTVLTQTGRLASIVQWVVSAYTDIQTHHREWRWLQGEYENASTGGKQRYSFTDLALPRLAAFDDDVYLYDPSVGVSSEAKLTFTRWDEFFSLYLVGSPRSQTGKPGYSSIDPSGQIVLWPTPDKAYTLHGQYRKSPQVLAADADVPEMPSRFHDIIVWKALTKLTGFDEATQQYSLFNVEYRRLLNELEHDQLPPITVSNRRFA